MYHLLINDFALKAKGKRAFACLPLQAPVCVQHLCKQTTTSSLPYQQRPSGLLGALTPLSSSLGAPLGAAFADRTGRHERVMLACHILSVAAR